MTSPMNPSKPAQAGALESNLVGGASMKVRPKTKKEVADEFGVHPKTMGTWCSAIGIEGRKKLTIKQVLDLYKHYGWPGDYEVKLHLD